MKNLVFLFALILPVVFNSCSSDDDDVKADTSIKIGKTEYKLYSEDTVQIDAKSSTSIKYETQSKYVAEVSNSGLITGGKVGKTIIDLTNGTDSKKVDVTIEAKYDLFPEPINKINFGDSSSKVKSTFGNPTNETKTSITYLSYHSFYNYVFLLDDKGNVRSMGVVFDTLKTPKTLSDFLIERYQIFALEGYTAGFTNEKQDMLIGLSPSEDLSMMMVIYMSVTKSRSGDDNCELKKEFNSVISLF